MIIATHTEHERAAAWVDILRASGVRVLGEAIPATWSEHAEEAVQPSFFATLGDQGVFYKTNPDPYSQVYLDASDVEGVALPMKVNAVLRSERAYVGHVIASMPHFRSLGAEGDPLPAVLLWWNDYVGLLRDASTRRYPLHLVSEEALARAPEATLRTVLGFVGAPITEAADRVARALPAPRPEDPRAGEALPPTVLDVFEELHRRVDRDEGFDRPFLERLYAVNQALTPQILRLQVATLKTQALRMRRRDAGD
jgi:hypothetical protein